jgi:hypothetical protein
VTFAFPIVVLLLYVIPLIVLWFVIYTAVLAALRRHERD